MKYAIIRNNIATHVFEPAEGETLESSMHPDLAAQFAEVPDYIDIDWIMDSNGDWSPIEKP